MDMLIRILLSLLLVLSFAVRSNAALRLVDTIVIPTQYEIIWNLARPGDGYIYAGFGAWYALGGTGTPTTKIYRISESTFTIVDSLTMESDENSFINMTAAYCNGYLYYATEQAPSKIIKIQTSNFTRVGRIVLESGEDKMRGMAIDCAGGYLYVGCNSNDCSPPKVVKIQLSDFTRVGAASLSANTEGNPMLIDPGRGYLYVGDQYVQRIALSTFTEYGSYLTVDNSYGVSIDAERGYAYWLPEYNEANRIDLDAWTVAQLELPTPPTTKDFLGVDSIHGGYTYGGSWTGKFIMKFKNATNTLDELYWTKMPDAFYGYGLVADNANKFVYQSFYAGDYGYINKYWDAPDVYAESDLIVDDTTKLLLHMNGPDASTTFTDSSRKPKTVTAYGNAQVDTQYSKFGGASLLCDGTGDYLVINDDPDWDFGKKNFTIEFWIKTSSTDIYDTILSRENGTVKAGAWIFMISGSGGYPLFWAGDYSTGAAMLNGGSNCSVHGCAAINDGKWHHVAVERFGETFYLYVDGLWRQRKLQQTFSFTALANNIYVCKDQQYTREIAASIDELMITVSRAKYLGDFTPPNAEYYYAPPRVDGLQAGGD
jgi:hypothetical protein